MGAKSWSTWCTVLRTLVFILPEMRNHWNVLGKYSELSHFISSINSSVFRPLCVSLLVITLEVTVLYFFLEY